MTIQWQTRIPKSIYARLYCGWRRVKCEVEILTRIFREKHARNLIEFGCGLGRHGYLLNKMGFNVLLTDAVDWRYGVTRKLPFTKLDVLDTNVSINSSFDAGYGLSFLTIFNYRNIIKVLENLGRIVNNGILVFDYNFAIYREPCLRRVEIGGKKYYAVLVDERVESNENSLLYRYALKIVGEDGRVIGLERGEYPVYDKKTLFRAISEAGFEVIDIVWVSWDPVEYMYSYVNSESDSAFIVLKKK